MPIRVDDPLWTLFGLTLQVESTFFLTELEFHRNRSPLCSRFITVAISASSQDYHQYSALNFL